MSLMFIFFSSSSQLIVGCSLCRCCCVFQYTATVVRDVFVSHFVVIVVVDNDDNDIISCWIGLLLLLPRFSSFFFLIVPPTLSPLLSLLRTDLVVSLIWTIKLKDHPSTSIAAVHQDAIGDG